MANFVLVHGAWHGGWCWQKASPYLEAAGQEVYAPTLTGMAERAGELSPEIGLDTHIQDIVRLLQEKDLRGAVLVGHSYGGMVITGVVDALPERVAHLVYLDTFVPREGESMAGAVPLLSSVLRRQAQAHGDGWRVPSFSDYGVKIEPERSWLLSMVTPQPLKSLEQPLHLKNPAVVSTKPRTHISCSGGGSFAAFMQHLQVYRAIPYPGWRRALPATEAGWRLRQLRTSHDAMITAPRELADLLLEVV